MESDKAVYTAAVYFTAFIVAGLMFWLELGWWPPSRLWRPASRARWLGHLVGDT
ncbi:MAG: hypothetical protein ACJ74F_13890 [Mycobacterium sp.]|jgi:hypothetical protein|uniref:hypothetical protein n=1 Tax=Mycobacterium sp. TaxID=1785 RepID=UPI00389ACCD5